MPTDLILSVLHQLRFDSVSPFLRSLRQTGSTARVHFFVNGISREDCQRIESLGATVEQFPYFTIRRNQPLLLLWPLWREILARLPSLDARCVLASRVMHLFGIRWILYRRFLRAHRGEFRRILVSDSRDVFFQRDPFATDFPPGLHCYQEAEGQTIGNCPYNRRTLGNPFGAAVLAELEDKPIVCAGTTFGDFESMLSYSELMINLLCQGRRFMEDQGTHNYIIHKRLIADAYVHENGRHAVRTVGLERTEKIMCNAAGDVLGFDGQVVPVLHQYDRHPALRQRLLSTLRS